MRPLFTLISTLLHINSNSGSFSFEFALDKHIKHSFSRLRLIHRNHMASIIYNGESQIFINLVVSCNGTIGDLEDFLLGVNKSINTSPVESGNIVVGTDGIANNIVLSTVKDDLKIRDDVLGKQVAVVSGIAGTNIRVEISVSLVNAILESDRRINTVSFLDGISVQPISIRS